PVDAKEELLDECDSLWKQIEEHQSKLMLLGAETLSPSDAKLSLLMLQWKALAVESHQWQAKNPEIISTNPDVLLELGKEELQKAKKDLEMMLSAVRSRNKNLEEALKREQQWYEEQKQMLDTLYETEDEENIPAEQRSTKSDLKSEILKLRTFKKELLSALGSFLDEHFPHPEKGENTKNKNSSAEPAVELKTLKEILEHVMNKSFTTPCQPYVTINESFWPPYIELLLRYGIALRHPQDPKRIRLQAFHQ
ncbi:CENPK protein, partial [Toxostoma redivivum]|nr:CENPK protein [Toxostoma redivivum]